MINSIYLAFRVDFKNNSQIDINSYSHISSLIIREIAKLLAQNNNCFYKFLIPYIDTVALNPNLDSYKLIGNKMLLHCSPKEVDLLENIFDTAVQNIEKNIIINKQELYKNIELNIFKADYNSDGLKYIVAKLFEVDIIESLCSLKNFSPDFVFLSCKSNLSLLFSCCNSDSILREISSDFLSFSEITNRVLTKKGCTINYSSNGEIVISVQNSKATSDFLNYIKEFITTQWKNKISSKYPLENLEVTIYE